MPSSVMNGAIGKSPLIDKMNQLAAKEIRSKTSAQLEKQVLQKQSLKYPSVPVSFAGCKEEMKKQIARRRKEKQV